MVSYVSRWTILCVQADQLWLIAIKWNHKYSKLYDAEYRIHTENITEKILVMLISNDAWLLHKLERKNELSRI